MDAEQPADRERWAGHALPGWIVLGSGETGEEAWARATSTLTAMRIATPVVAGRPVGGRIIGLPGYIRIDLLCGRGTGTTRISVLSDDLAQAARLVRGTVRVWHPNEGWGVLDAPETPGGCWVHFRHLGLRGYGYLEPGTAVDFAWEAAEQDGFAYRALVVAYAQD
ncbi:hypothetical protein Cme02nite_37280 [Catellatospora methionotrophica]|uniref:Uncharacterized protein n=1 Tax=Catellatospora methionotrophica TaxID=121620 RepID=A0A8J3LHR2_9ACTN|nr:hypothetical protein [Catellatospora methionotrophica]GIG15396.1 hypothetical protein Cme02nite_37280 [Catellatospora methionotrophica]